MGRKPASPSFLSPPASGVLAGAVVLAILLTATSAQQQSADGNLGFDFVYQNAPIELTLEHRPKRSLQNPHPYTASAAAALVLQQPIARQAEPTPKLAPISQTYTTLDCYARWKFRALLDGAGYKVHNDTVPLCDNGAEFYAVIGVGTPPQHFYVQVDTGSALFAVPAAGCTTCAGHAADRYKRNNSSTAHGYSCADVFHCTAMRCYGDTFECGFHSQYQDTSYINGVLLKEKLTFGNRTFDGMFGAIYEAAGTFSATYQVDGILGLSYFSDLSCLPSCVPPLWDSMVSAFNLPDVFALDLPAPNKGVAKLTLGGTGRARPDDVHWTPIMQESYYVVDLKEVDVAGVPIKYDPADMGQVIVDSGTTLLVLPRNIFEALKEGFLSGKCTVIGICEHSRRGDNIFNTCFDRTTFTQLTNNLTLYPNITFKFPGVQVDLMPHQYLRIQLRSSYCVELAIAPIDNTLTILGDTFMRDRVTIFDRANKRVGFTNARAYVWTGPPAEEWVWWTIACSLAGFTLVCVASLGFFVYSARQYKRQRMPHYEPLILAVDELDDLDDGLSFALPPTSSAESSSSSSSPPSRVLRAGVPSDFTGKSSNEAMLVNPAFDDPSVISEEVMDT